MSPPRSVIEQIYREHPLRAETILARLRRDGIDPDRVTERVLSSDPQSEITDQNHIGGRAFSEALARACGVSRSTYVADLGCGLGGTARVLAEKFGCRVEGYDVSRQRIRDARALTRLAQLSVLVSLRVADIMSVPIPAARYDVIFGQGALVHIEDKWRLVARWRRGLRPHGRFAIEDACTQRLPASRAERGLLARLETGWAASLVRPSTWADLCRNAGFHDISEEDLSAELPVYYTNLIERSGQRGRAIPARERRSWRDAIAAHQSGLLGLYRIVATLP